MGTFLCGRVCMDIDIHVESRDWCQLFDLTDNYLNSELVGWDHLHSQLAPGSPYAFQAAELQMGEFVQVLDIWILFLIAVQQAQAHFIHLIIPFLANCSFLISNWNIIFELTIYVSLGIPHLKVRALF